MNANAFNIDFAAIPEPQRDQLLRAIIALEASSVIEMEQTYSHITARPATQWRARAIALIRGRELSRPEQRINPGESIGEARARISRVEAAAIKTVEDFLSPTL